MKQNMILTLVLLTGVVAFVSLFVWLYLGTVVASDPICELPNEYMESPYWVDSVVQWSREEINCKDTQLPKDEPVLMEYDVVSRQDRLRKKTGFGNLTCQYRPVHYGYDNDNYYHEEWHALVEGEPLMRGQLMNCSTSEEAIENVENNNDGLTKFVLVQCLDPTNNDTVVYEDVHMFMPDLTTFQNGPNNVTTNRPSVLILAIESMTRLNFLRSMPKTVDALRELSPMFYLKGFTRIADNTFPNMLAFFTGRKEEDFEEVSDKPLDLLPAIWKQFEARGYPTAVIDDNPHISRSILSYGNEGFTRPPTTFYPQPYWTYHITPKDGYKASNCLGSKPVPEVMLSQLHRFIAHSEAHALPYFALAMLIRTTHDGWRDANKLDRFYERFIRDISHRLSNTFLIVMGDHGDRYSSEMSDYEAGKFESRMPLMAIRLPSTWLYKSPQMGDVLLKNKKRLTTMLDIHKTLVQIAQGAGQSSELIDSDQTVYTESAYSVLSELVPLNRTCEQARIDELYCVCQMKQVSENVNSSVVKSATTHLISGLNSILPMDKCQRLQLSRIESVIWFVNSLLDSVIGMERLELTVTVAPSEALLRTRLSRSALNGNWTSIRVGHEIERLNLYGNQSHCIQHRVLRKYCLCHDITPVVSAGNSSSQAFNYTSKSSNSTIAWSQSTMSPALNLTLDHN